MNIPDELKEKIGAEDFKILKDAVEEERKKNPITIAIIGKTGTGKTSTINSLFGTEWPISHFQACTKIEQAITLSVPSPKGYRKDNVLKIYDMPGLGEDIEADKKHWDTHRKVLGVCDVIVWLIKADSFDFAEDQEALQKITVFNADLIERIVIGLNQVDLLNPFNWLKEINLPSDEQVDNIKSKLKYVQSMLLSVCTGLTAGRIIPYSALKRYQLNRLFEGMIGACPERRKWMLGVYLDNVANFLDLVNPKYRKLVEGL